MPRWNRQAKLKPAVEAALRREFPGLAPTQVLELAKSGVLRLPKKLDFGKCGAWARSAKRPCIRNALANGRCPNHGGLSTGLKTKAGRKRCAEAARRGMLAYWETRRQEAKPQ